MPTQTRSDRNPFSGLIDFVSDMNRMSDRMHGMGSHGETEARSHVNAWTPSVDIAAVDDQLVIDAELSGVTDEDVEVTYTAPTLTIAGQRRLHDVGVQQATYYTKELSWGRFRRDITLPHGIHRDDITVTLTNGLLRITVHRYTQIEGSAHLSINNELSQR